MIDIPNVIAYYNKHMGGVDLFDQSVSAYRSKIRVKKWYWPIFLYMLDGSISNAWHIYRDVRDSSVGLLEFRRMIGQSLLVPRQKKIIDKKAVVPLDNLRYDRMDHYPQKCKQRRCPLCHKKSTTQCIKCNVGLCFDCFREYHTR